MPIENRRLTAVMLGLLLGGVIVCVWRITSGTPSPSEALLLSVLLTIFSTSGSWLASRYYSEYSFNRNLRMFALKAAEKVTNLSNELDRLSMFLQEELKETEYESPNESLLAKNLRIEGAIHIINTLKSANDRSLSDWQGVIGDEIIAQREVQEEREESLREILERLDSLSVSHVTASDGVGQVSSALRADIESLRNDVRLLAAQVSGVPIRQTRSLRRKQDVERKCPKCAHPIQYRQRATPNGVKAVECTECGSRLCSREVNGEFILQLRAPVAEEVLCPSCTSKLTVSLDPVPGTGLEVDCTSCKALLRVVRGTNSVRIKLRKEGERGLPVPPPSEELIKKVGELMGPQPWPTGRARKVAEELGVHIRIVSRAVEELVRRGAFKLQINGKLFVPASTDARGGG